MSQPVRQYGVRVAGLLLLLAVLAAWWRQSARPEPIIVTPTLTGRPEMCLTCHQGVEEISSSHPIETFGCVRCHGGDGLAVEADVAHTGLIGGRNPSALAVVEQGCGGADCHSGDPAAGRDHIDRVLTSIQATYAGAIAQVRHAFGAQPDPTARAGVRAVASLAAFDPAGDPAPVQQFAANCLTCHLWSTSEQGHPYTYRAEGCAACHVLYDDDGLYKGSDPTVPKDEPGHGREHRLTTAIPFSQCNHCHNRGNYNLVRVTFIARDDLPPPAHFNAIERRLAEYYQPIGLSTRCEWELDCVDCHTAGEVMGDGQIYNDQSEIQYVQCRTCHGTLTERPALATITDPDDPALRRAFVNPNHDLAVGDTVVVTEQGEKLGAVRWADGRLVQTSKVSGRQWEVPLVMGTACEQKPDEQESRYCHACHAYER